MWGDEEGLVKKVKRTSNKIFNRVACLVVIFSVVGTIIERFMFGYSLQYGLYGATYSIVIGLLVASFLLIYRFGKIQHNYTVIEKMLVVATLACTWVVVFYTSILTMFVFVVIVFVTLSRVQKKEEGRDSGMRGTAG